MSAHSQIEWTDSSWNPVTGCRKISEGCAWCYAERFAQRHMGEFAKDHNRVFSQVKLHPEKLDLPLHWRKGKKVFVNSMSDLFLGDPIVPTSFVDEVFVRMILAPQHTYQILTKHPDVMCKYTNDPALRERLEIRIKIYVDISFRPQQRREILYKLETGLLFKLPLKNVWLGTSVENQKRADERREHLRETKAVVRWVSYEPALENIYWREYTFLNWLVCGGESGREARPCATAWFSNAKNFCDMFSIPFFMKQLGTVLAKQYKMSDDHGGDIDEFPVDLQVREFPK